MTFCELSCDLPAATSMPVASDFATAFFNPAFRGPVPARTSLSSRRNSSVSARALCQSERIPATAACSSRTCSRNSRTESLDAALNSEEGRSARFRASCAMPDAVHAVTPIRIADRKNSNQLVIRMSPPALSSLRVCISGLHSTFAFRICVQRIRNRNYAVLCRLPGCQSIFRRGIQRNIYPECRSRRRRLFHRDVAAVILQNLLHHGQSHPGAIFLAVAHKRLEQAVTHRVRDSWTVILDANFQALAFASQLDIDFPGFRRHHLARVQQQVQKSAFQFLEIKPALGRTSHGNPNPYALEFRMRLPPLHRSIDRRANVAVRWMQRLPCA